MLWQICCGEDAKAAVAALATRLTEQQPPKMLRVSHHQPGLGRGAIAATSGLNFDLGGDGDGSHGDGGEAASDCHPPQERTQLASLADLTQIHQVRRQLVAATY